jgi:hypothetical protein
MPRNFQKPSSGSRRGAQAKKLTRHMHRDVAQNRPRNTARKTPSQRTHLTPFLTLRSHCPRTLVLSAVIGLRIWEKGREDASRMGKKEHG